MLEIPVFLGLFFFQVFNSPQILVQLQFYVMKVAKKCLLSYISNLIQLSWVFLDQVQFIGGTKKICLQSAMGNQYSLTKKPFLAMSSDNKEAYSFGNFKHKFTFTQVILYSFFSQIKGTNFQKIFLRVFICNWAFTSCGRCCTNFDYFLHYLRGTLVYYQYFFLSSVSKL